MRYVLLVCLLGLAIALDLTVFVAASDHSLASFDPLHPATLLPIVTGRLHALRSQVRELDMREFFDALAAPYRKRIQRESPPLSQPR
jgi:hypothetical protein